LAWIIVAHPLLATITDSTQKREILDETGYGNNLCYGQRCCQVPFQSIQDADICNLGRSLELCRRSGHWQRGLAHASALALPPSP
jgi:hypothetical protein